MRSIYLSFCSGFYIFAMLGRSWLLRVILILTCLTAGMLCVTVDMLDGGDISTHIDVVRDDIVVLGLVDGSIAILDASNGMLLLTSDTGGAMVNTGSSCEHKEDRFEVPVMPSDQEYHPKLEATHNSPTDHATDVSSLKVPTYSFKSAKVVPALDGTVWSVMDSDHIEINKLKWSVQDVVDSEYPVEVEDDNIFGTISGKALLTGSRNTDVFALKFSPAEREPYILIREVITASRAITVQLYLL